MRESLGIILPQVGDNSDLQPLLGHRTIGTLPFGGRYRLIDFSLSNIVNSGISKVGIIGSIKYSSIIDHLGTGKEWLLSRKTNDLTILTGSVNRKLSGNFKINMQDFILNKSFFEKSNAKNVVLAGPNLVTTFNFDNPYEVYSKNDADAVLVYRPEASSFKTIPSDVFLTLDGHRVTKLTFADEETTDLKYADMMIIKRSTLLDIIAISERSEEYDLMRILMENLDKLKVYGYKHEGYINRVFDIQKYYQANMDLLNYDVIKELFLSEQPVYTKVKDNHPARYGKEDNISDCIFGSGSYIDGKVNQSIIFRDVEIKEGSEVNNSIIMQKCKIGKNCHLDHVIFDKEVTIRDNTTLQGSEEKPIIMSKATKI